LKHLGTQGASEETKEGSCLDFITQLWPAVYLPLSPLHLIFTSHYMLLVVGLCGVQMVTTMFTGMTVV